MRKSSALWLSSIGVALLALACSSSNDFVSAPSTDGGAGTAGSGGTAAGGSGGSGTAGSGGSAGTAGTAGAAGSGAADGGVPCSGDGSCGPGHYCGDDKACHACTDTTRFHFGAAETLDHINAAHPSDWLRYPRAIGDHGLIYTVEGQTGWTRAIWVTQDFTTSAGQEGSASADGNGAPLVTAPPATGALSSYNFYFDNAIPNTLRRQVVGATIDSTGNMATATPLAAPINNSNSNSNYSFALASGSGRAWWTSDRSGAFQFQVFTADVLAGGSATAVQVSLTTAPSNCPLDVIDPSPWATPDGKLLLFDSSEHYTDCTNKNAPLDMFYAFPDQNGKVSAQAQQINVDLQAVNDSQPSLSPDMCWLYFASDRNGAKTTRLYRAHRR